MPGGDLWSSVPAPAAPTAVVDLDAFDANLAAMVARAQGRPLRLASKSVRCRALIERALESPGFSGVLAYSAAEAAWLVSCGVRDVVVGYPTVDSETIADTAAAPSLAEQVTFMVDLPEHVAMLAAAAGTTPLRVCIDVDASLRIGRLHLGVHRSSVHTTQEVCRIARLVADTPGVTLVGLMFYEAQVAGVPDSSRVVRAMKLRSMAQLLPRRTEIVRAVAEISPLEFVNGGGTGSIAATRRDPSVTEIAAGSGLFTPTLFDSYDDSGLTPAAYFVSPVVRKPTPAVAVTFAGGYVASGPASKSRTPKPVHPQGLSYFGQEGAGEVQTPLRGPGARSLRVGDPVWFRYAKAGEMCERFDELLLVRDGAVVQRALTYRGEGRTFG
ncbi:alanine racemase [Allobranchiibius huperziae]|uniref:D-serine deaminase-like pyridoxal phosphate-dependent protein n=1 Tax=Allobranchiibius huperziae TaxID=1874116 RepID=A0A853DNU6_9MICO|nr:D-serine deaminase-like pyridoxal phosphate-dependent protein [Allobranchiibius huperziae]